MVDAALRDKVLALNLLNPTQRDLVTQDIRNLESALGGHPMAYTGQDASASGYVPGEAPMHPGAASGYEPMPVPEPALLEEALRRDRETLALGSAPPLSAHAKNQLYQQYKAEVEAYQTGLLNNDQLNEPTWAHVRQYMQHEELNQERTRFITNAHRILDQEDDGFSMEMFRPLKRCETNFPLFRQNYDAVQWSDGTERALRSQELDEDTYRAFVTLRVLSSAPKLIQQRLNIDQAMYEACVERLNRDIGAIGGVPDEPPPPAPKSARVRPPSILDDVEQMTLYSEWIDAVLEKAETLAVETFVDAWQCSKADGRKVLQHFRVTGKLKGLLNRPFTYARADTAQEVG